MKNSRLLNTKNVLSKLKINVTMQQNNSDNNNNNNK